MMLNHFFFCETFKYRSKEHTFFFSHKKGYILFLGKKESKSLSQNDNPALFIFTRFDTKKH